MASTQKICIPADIENANYTKNKIKKFSFGNKKVIISDEELSELENIYKYYVETFGVEIGFINYLLNLH